MPPNSRMTTVTISSKFQMHVPKSTRQNLDLRAGEKMVIIDKAYSFEVVKIGPIEEAEGMIPRTSWKDVRDHRERFG